MHEAYEVSIFSSSSSSSSLGLYDWHFLDRYFWVTFCVSFFRKLLSMMVHYFVLMMAIMTVTTNRLWRSVLLKVPSSHDSHWAASNDYHHELSEPAL